MGNFLLESGDEEWLLDGSYTATLPFPIAILNSKGKLLYTNNPLATVIYRLQASSPCQPQLVKGDDQVKVYRCLGGLTYLATYIRPQGTESYILLSGGVRLPTSNLGQCPTSTPEGVKDCCQTAPFLSGEEFALPQQQLLQVAQELAAQFDRRNQRQVSELQAQLLGSVTKYPNRLTPTLLCNKLAETLAQLPGIAYGAAAMVEPETGQIELFASQGNLPPDLPFSSFCTGLASRVIYEGKARVLEDPNIDPTIPFSVAEEVRAYMGQIACCPVQLQGKTIALLFAGCPPQTTFDVARMQALSSLAKLAALYFDRLQSQNKILAQQRWVVAMEHLYTAVDAQVEMNSLLSTCVNLASEMLDVEKAYIRLTTQKKSWAQRGLCQELIDVLQRGQEPDRSSVTEFPLWLSNKTLGFLGIINCGKTLLTTAIEQLCRLIVMPIFCHLTLGTRSSASQADNKGAKQYRCTSDANQGMETLSNPNLTSRERQVLDLVAKGYTNKEIATALGVTEKTIKVHLGNIMRKLDASDRTNAVVTALQQGLINLTLR